jgi:hemoglobin
MTTIQEPSAGGSDMTPYQAIGGDAKVRALVDRFYDLMDLDDRYHELRAVHPATLDSARDKLYWFLSGWLGGPSLYIDKFGHPRLRARHLPFRITSVERDQWMACMVQAMHDQTLDQGLIEALTKALYGTADWMRNTEDPA